MSLQCYVSAGVSTKIKQLSLNQCQCTEYATLTLRIIPTLLVHFSCRLLAA